MWCFEVLSSLAEAANFLLPRDWTGTVCLGTHMFSQRPCKSVSQVVDPTNEGHVSYGATIVWLRQAAPSRAKVNGFEVAVRLAISLWEMAGASFDR